MCFSVPFLFINSHLVSRNPRPRDTHARACPYKFVPSVTCVLRYSETSRKLLMDVLLICICEVPGSNHIVNAEFPVWLFCFPQYLHGPAGIEPWYTPQWVFFSRSPQIYLVQRPCVIIRCDVTLPVDTAWLKCAAHLSICPYSDVHVYCRGSDKNCRFLLSANTRLRSLSFCSAFAEIVWPSQEGTRLSVHTLRLSCIGITVLCHLCKCGAGGLLCQLGRG
jgi:hypothetical protein